MPLSGVPAAAWVAVAAAPAAVAGAAALACGWQAGWVLLGAACALPMIAALLAAKPAG
jgi:hypothetical protein